MSKSVLVMETPTNCYDCPFGTEYCGNINLIIRYLMTVALGIRKKFLFVKNVKKDIGEVK